MSDQDATVVQFPLERRAQQIADDLDSVDARLADTLRPMTLRLMTVTVPPEHDDGPAAA